MQNYVHKITFKKRKNNKQANKKITHTPPISGVFRSTGTKLDFENVRK